MSPNGTNTTRVTAKISTSPSASRLDGPVGDAVDREDGGDVARHEASLLPVMPRPLIRSWRVLPGAVGQAHHDARALVDAVDCRRA